MNNLIKLSKFKPEYTDFIFDQIAQFRTEKDEKLLMQIDPYDENNLEKVSFDLVLDERYSNSPLPVNPLLLKNILFLYIALPPYNGKPFDGVSLSNPKE